MPRWRASFCVVSPEKNSPDICLTSRGLVRWRVGNHRVAAESGRSGETTDSAMLPVCIDEPWRGGGKGEGGVPLWPEDMEKKGVIQGFLTCEPSCWAQFPPTLSPIFHLLLRSFSAPRRRKVNWAPGGRLFPPSLRRCMEHCAGRPSPLCETKRVVTSLAPLDQSISGKAGKAKCQE